MANFDYDAFLETCGDTLENLSEDTSKSTETNKIFLTTSRKKAINFDKFVHTIAEKIDPQKRPKSCDALLKLNNSYYFIEFKNGRIREKHEEYEIREKILESILLFLEQVNQTICYSRNNCYFILVCNKNSATKGIKRNKREEIFNHLEKKINFYKYENIYLKRTFVYSIDNFNNDFIKRYGL